MNDDLRQRCIEAMTESILGYPRDTPSAWRAQAKEQAERALDDLLPIMAQGLEDEASRDGQEPAAHHWCEVADFLRSLGGQPQTDTASVPEQSASRAGTLVVRGDWAGCYDNKGNIIKGHLRVAMDGHVHWEKDE